MPRVRRLEAATAVDEEVASTAAIRVMPGTRVLVTFVGGPRDGEPSSLVSGAPPAVLVVDDSGGRYVWRDGRYEWVSWPYEVVID